MAKIAVLTDTNTKIAEVTIPNTFSDFVKRIVGGTTNAETAQLFLNEIVPIIRMHFYNKRTEQLRVTPTAAIKQAELDASTELATEW